MNDLGDTLLVVNDDEIVKVHVHTEDPGLVMQEGLKYGSLIKVKVDNMRNQHEAQVEKEATQGNKPAETKEYALIAVVAGQGLADIFRAQGVDYVIEGGQTMNPSTEDFIKAVEQVNACLLYTSGLRECNCLCSTTLACRFESRNLLWCS